jgi:hypothetical protein
MSRIVFHGPVGREVLDPSLEFLHAIILSPSEGYWVQGSGGGTLEFLGTGPSKSRLLILPHEGLGYYLKYLEIIRNRIETTWLSLGDKDKLSEVTTCSDEWLASVGLFLAPADAAIAIEDFVVTGQPSQRVDWIKPDAIPAEGNW